MKTRWSLALLIACSAVLLVWLHVRAQSAPARPAAQTGGKARPAGGPVTPKVQEALLQPANDHVTQGALRVLDEKGQTKGECPLKHTDVQVSISGSVARVNVAQQFHNPSKEKIEAVYTFPLSQDGAVDEMTMKVGQRTIRGQIKRREEARRIYEEAKAAGHVASLLDQERPNIFTQSVANILPGEEVEVRISYVETLTYDEGTYKFAFPMVVGPRYIPGRPAVGDVPPVRPATGREGLPATGRTAPRVLPVVVGAPAAAAPAGTGWAPDTDQVPDASRVTPPVTPEGTRAGHDLSLTVDLDAGVPIDDVRSELHEVTVERPDSASARVALAQKKTIPNKDFLLTWKPAGDDIADAVLTHADDRGKFLTLMLQPPRRITPERIAPREMVFVIDTSGSQMGWPIEKAKETMKVCIEGMHPDDTFNLLAFSNDVVRLFEKPKRNTPANREAALRFLGERLGSGGTEMLKAIDAALLPEADPERLRVICFMTDGYVGNDMEILGRVQKHRGTARFFSFGVGNSVNRFLLDKMAEVGRGEVEYVTLDAAGRQAAERFHKRIASPVLTDISVDWGGLPVADVYPRGIPDLFTARPVVLKARYTAPASGVITLRGKAAGRPFSREIRVDLPAAQKEHDVLAPLWARARIDDLMNRDWSGVQSGAPKPEVKEEITGLGLDYRLMTQYTSFVAVEEMVVTEGGHPRTIAVPVEMPEGVSYKGVFGDKEGRPARMAVSGRMAAVGKTAYRGQALARSVPASAPAPGGAPGMPAGPAAAPVATAAPIAQVPAIIAAGRREEVADAVEAPKPARPLSPAEQREALLNARLAPELRALLKNPSGSPAVKDGRVEVAVWLADTSEKTLAALKGLGFEVVLQARSVKMVVGRIPVAKMEALALLDGVRRVEPPQYAK